MVGEIFLSESGRTYTSLGDAPKRGRNRAIIAKSEGENFFLRTIRKGSREAVILSKLDHPGILSNLDIASSQEGDCYLVFHYFGNNCSLTELVAEHSSHESLMPSVIATADALAYMHSVGVLHLDIKPDNVLVIDPEAGDIRCIDFESATDEIGVKSPVLGCTRPYVSPEYYLGYSPTKSVDVYAFGISMYGSLGNTGLPKRQDTRISTSFRQLDYKRVIAHLGDQTYAESLGFVTPRMVREKFGSNRALRKTITSCIDVNPSNRPTMNEVSLDLATI